MAWRKLNPWVLLVLVPVHLVVTRLAWRDLNGRSAEQVRGSIRLWRIATASNMSWSLAYLLIGRKHSTASSRSH